MNQEEYELEQPQQRQFSHSIKLEETAKGVRISVHVYAESAESARQQALKTYLGIEHDLTSHGVRLAPIHCGEEFNGVKP